MVVAMFGVAIGLGGVAFATIPDSSGKVHACYVKGNGNLRVVESASACRKNETAIEWNQQGPKGDPGPPGDGGSGASNNIIVRARSTGSVTTPSLNTDFSTVDFSGGAVVPMVGNEWTQGATEIETTKGVLTYTKPFSGHCPEATGREFAAGVFRVVTKIDGKAVENGGSAFKDTRQSPDPPGTYETGVGIPDLFEPGVATPHVVTFEVADNCGDGHHFVVDSIKFDVVALR
jgi:hypothetical protein